MDSLLSIAGSVASLGGAYWAWKEAFKAAASASKAESVRNELVDRRKLVEVSQLFAQSNQIINVVAKIGPSCNSRLLKGIDCVSIAREIEEYTRFLNIQNNHFSQLFGNKATTICNDLRIHIEELSEAKQPVVIKEIGKKIYYLISEFMPCVKDLTDQKRETSLVENEDAN